MTTPMTSVIIEPRLNVKKSVVTTVGRTAAATIRIHGVRALIAAPRHRAAVIAVKMPSAFQYPIGW